MSMCIVQVMPLQAINAYLQPCHDKWKRSFIFLLYCVNSLAAETTRHFSKFSRIWLGAKYVLLKEQFTLN